MEKYIKRAVNNLQTNNTTILLKNYHTIMRVNCR